MTWLIIVPANHFLCSYSEDTNRSEYLDLGKYFTKIYCFLWLRDKQHYKLTLNYTVQTMTDINKPLPLSLLPSESIQKICTDNN